MIRLLQVFVLAVFVVVTVSAQNESSRSGNDTVRVKEAPENMQRLLREISMEQQEGKIARDADLEIFGMLIDETKTKGGRDFFDYFYMKWEAPAKAKNFTIFVKESPYRLTVTQIEVRLNETLVFRSFLQPRNDIIEEYAEYAVAQTRRYLENYEALIRQLDGEDRAGTGIF